VHRCRHTRLRQPLLHQVAISHDHSELGEDAVAVRVRPRQHLAAEFRGSLGAGEREAIAEQGVVAAPDPLSPLKSPNKAGASGIRLGWGGPRVDVQPSRCFLTIRAARTIGSSLLRDVSAAQASHAFLAQATLT
jgi:hypothetical protein